MIHDRLSVNAISSWNQGLAEDIELWAKLGVRDVVVQRTKLEAAGTGAVACLRAAGVRVRSLVTPPPFTLGDPARWAAQRDDLQTAIELAAELGSPSVYFTTGGAASRTTTDDAVAAFAAAVRPVLETAASAGVRLAVEHNSTMTRDTGCVHTLRDAIGLCEETGIGVVVELQNCWYERDLPELFRRGLDGFALVQVSDFIVGTTQRLQRACPGDGDMPLEELIGALLDVGYDGFFDLEILGRRIEAEGYKSAIARGAAVVSGILNRHAA